MIHEYKTLMMHVYMSQACVIFLKVFIPNNFSDAYESCEKSIDY